MGVLEGLEPRAVFHFFEEICQIPHGSGNTDQISNYLVSFAKERNLEHYQDKLGNIIIIKEATAGYEQAPPVLVQGHMDMVAVKEPDCSINMEKEGLSLLVEGDYVSAKGTSLGGDDGIAIAYALAVLDSDEIPHPRLEVVMTIDEEVGMEGAAYVDLSCCRAHIMMNLDSEEEGIFLAGCAGGARVDLKNSYLTGQREGELLTLSVSGLQGGHSGVEIHKERANANCLLIRILRELMETGDLCVISLKGGSADNVIPDSARAEVLFCGDQEAVKARLAEIEKDIKIELRDKDAGFSLQIKFDKMQKKECMTKEDSKQLIRFLYTLPNGVQAMSGAMKDLVETSLNFGTLSVSNGELKAGFSVRSSVESSKKSLILRLKDLGALSGVTVSVSGNYPGWIYRKDSPLRDKIERIYQEMYGKEPQIQAIHAGLECGLFAEKIPDLDCVSMGPDIEDIHTTKERLSISSTNRVYQFFLKVLEDMKWT